MTRTLKAICASGLKHYEAAELLEALGLHVVADTDDGTVSLVYADRTARRLIGRLIGGDDDSATFDRD